MARSRRGHSGDGQPSSKARPNRREMSRSRSRQSSKARSNRNRSGPIRAARSRRSARRLRSNRSWRHGGACAARGGGRQEGDGRRLHSPRSQPGQVAARLRVAGPLRGLRGGHRGSRRFLPVVLGQDGMARQCRLPALRPATGRDRDRDLRTLSCRSAQARPDAGRGRLRRPAAVDCAAAEIWAKGCAGPDHGPLHDPAERRLGRQLPDHPGAVASVATVETGVQPIGTSWPANWARSWGLSADSSLLRRVKRTQPLKGLNHVQRRKAVVGRIRRRRCRSDQAGGPSS